MRLKPMYSPSFLILPTLSGTCNEDDFPNRTMLSTTEYYISGLSILMSLSKM